MVQGCQSCFTSLAADRVSAARPHPTFAPLLHHPRPKTRVRVFSGSPSGRLSRRGVQSPINTPGLRACAYKTASGRRQWLNRDPIEEDGGPNLYTFLNNSPLSGIDADGRQFVQPGDPFPKSACSDDANKSQIGTVCTGNAPVMRAASCPGAKCKEGDKPRKHADDGKEMKDCPGYGKIEVKCTKFEACIGHLKAGANGEPFTLDFRWTPQRTCQCPPPPASPNSKK